MKDKQEQLEAIYESYVNGQIRQALEQAKEYGLYDFACDCLNLSDDLGVPTINVLKMYKHITMKYFYLYINEGE